MKKMKTVSQTAALCGVSVRTLHHYDTIGLLKPSAVSEKGYRFYDDEAINRLGDILLFRELRFPLAEIRRIIDDPDYDRAAALKEQLGLLKIQRERLDEVIALVEKMTKEGENNMDISVFGKEKEKEYAAEARRRWGTTAEYKQYEERIESKTQADKENAADEMAAIFAGFGKIKSLSPASPEAAAAVRALQGHISSNYYDCNEQMLLCLGEMYVNDERFRANIDSAGGDGTAEFVGKAIKALCGINA